MGCGGKEEEKAEIEEVTRKIKSIGKNIYKESTGDGRKRRKALIKESRIH